MRFRAIPALQRLTNMAASKDAAERKLAAEEYENLAKQLFTCEGFVLVVHAMRELEQSTLQALRMCTDSAQAHRMIGGLNMIESLRQSLTGYSSPAQPTPDFYEEGGEEYIHPLLEENVEPLR